MSWEHPEEVEVAEAAEREAAEAQKAAAEEDDRVTKDGFLKATNRRTERPSLFPPQLSDAPGDALPPWERERLDIDG